VYSSAMSPAHYCCDRVAHCASIFPPPRSYVADLEIGDESRHCLGQDVITQVETMYYAAKCSRKVWTRLRFSREPAYARLETVSPGTQNIPGHRIRSGLTRLVSYYETDAGHHWSRRARHDCSLQLAAR